MNYKIIHDSIIDRARYRKLSESIYTEKHHIIPKCEGGLESGETVRLTLKEHRLIHLLRYKFTGIYGNKNAHNWMCQGIQGKIQTCQDAGKISHVKLKEKNPILYKQKQSKAGFSAGIKAKELKLGFHSLTKEQLNESRSKGRKTMVENKLGMFSDEYRQYHKTLLRKKVKTPQRIFDSMTEAAIFYNVSRGTLTYRVNSNKIEWKDWYYINGEKK